MNKENIILEVFQNNLPEDARVQIALQSKLSSATTLKEATDYFNLDLKKIEEEISQMINGGKKPVKKQKKTHLLSETEKKKLSETIQNLGEKVLKLTPLESKIITVLENNDITPIKKQLKVISNKSKSLKGYDKLMVESCIKNIKELSTVKDAVYKVYELNETVNNLLKEGSDKFKIDNLNFVNNITVSCVDDSQAPQTIFVEFNIFVTPQGESYSEVKKSLEDIYRVFTKLGPSVVNTAIFWKDLVNQPFTGEYIWDATMRTNINKSMPNTKVVGKAELALYVSPEVKKPLKDFRAEVIDVLNTIDSNIETWIPEVINNKN